MIVNLAWCERKKGKVIERIVTEEEGMKETPRLKGFGSLYKRGPIWWIRYSVRGRDIRESSGSEKESDAMVLLKRRWKEIGKGRFIGPQEDKVTIDELLDALVDDYAINQRRSLSAVKGSLKHLRDAFSGMRANEVTEARIERYKATRITEKIERGNRLTKPATVNRELAALRKAFRLGVRCKRISAAPEIALLAENNVRQGFLEPSECEALVEALPAYLRDFARFAYITGWRKGELQSLTWADVNRDAKRILLRSENSKNGESRLLPLSGKLVEIIERRWKERVIANGTRFAEFVFHRDGEQIREFRKTWAKACQVIGKPGLLFHDLRRSAVRNFDQAGVSQPVGMMISGHKTASVYRRYRITPEQDIRDALERTESFSSKKVVRIADKS